jgi:hypothetical protein
MKNSYNHLIIMSIIYQLQTINSKLEHDKDTKVPFRRKTFVIHGIKVEGVFPVFNGIEVKLDEYYMSDAFWIANKNSDATCYREQMKAASMKLSEYLKKSPSLAARFTKEQIAAIHAGNDVIPGFSWHHKEDWLVMQLVNTQLHSLYKHTGGSYTWNKKHFQ